MARCTRRADRLKWQGERPSMTLEQCEALIRATMAAYPDFRGELRPRRVRVGDFRRCEAWNVMHYWYPPRRIGGTQSDGDRMANWIALTHLKDDSRENVENVKRKLLEHLDRPVPGISVALHEAALPNPFGG